VLAVWASDFRTELPYLAEGLGVKLIVTNKGSVFSHAANALRLVNQRNAGVEWALLPRASKPGPGHGVVVAAEQLPDSRLSGPWGSVSIVSFPMGLQTETLAGRRPVPAWTSDGQLLGWNWLPGRHYGYLLLRVMERGLDGCAEQLGGVPNTVTTSRSGALLVLEPRSGLEWWSMLCDPIASAGRVEWLEAEYDQLFERISLDVKEGREAGGTRLLNHLEVFFRSFLVLHGNFDVLMSRLLMPLGEHERNAVLNTMPRVVEWQHDCGLYGDSRKELRIPSADMHLPDFSPSSDVASFKSKVQVLGGIDRVGDDWPLRFARVRVLKEWKSFLSRYLHGRAAGALMSDLLLGGDDAHSRRF